MSPRHAKAVARIGNRLRRNPLERVGSGCRRHEKGACPEGGAWRHWNQQRRRSLPADPGTLGASTQLSRYSWTL